MKEVSPFKLWFFRISAILILLAVVVFYFNIDIAKWMMIIGVAGYASCVFTTPYPGSGVRGRRLFNMQVFAVILMAVSSYLLFIGRMEWVVLLLLAAILTLYSTFMMDRTYRQEQEENQKSKKK